MLFRKDTASTETAKFPPPQPAVKAPPVAAKTAPPPGRQSPFAGVNAEGVVLVGKGTKSTGEIKNASVIEIQGDFDGDVTASAVIVREGATFKGNIYAEFVEAHGFIEGSLIAEQLLDIRSTGNITAEVRYGQLCIATGGRISGNIQTHTIEGAALERADLGPASANPGVSAGQPAGHLHVVS